MAQDYIKTSFNLILPMFESGYNYVMLILTKNQEVLMNTEQLIHQKISRFPPKLQQQVLEFVEVLENKLKINSQEILPVNDEAEAW